jgi:hypothetical protein
LVKILAEVPKTSVRKKEEVQLEKESLFFRCLIGIVPDIPLYTAPASTD